MNKIHLGVLLLLASGCGGRIDQPQSGSASWAAEVRQPVVAESTQEPADMPEGQKISPDAETQGSGADIQAQKSQRKPGAGKEETEKVVRSEAEWRRKLTPEQYHVLRKKGTERPFTNKFDHHFEPGTYSCAACAQVLFSSQTKFNSGCGWPAFYAAEAGDRVKLTADYSLGMVRTEVTCARCDSHLGHIFDDAPQTPTGQRYCINSVSLTFTPAKPTPKGEAAEPGESRR